jgi:hypothetical protein
MNPNAAVKERAMIELHCVLELIVPMRSVLLSRTLRLRDPDRILTVSDKFFT